MKPLGKASPVQPMTNAGSHRNHADMNPIIIRIAILAVKPRTRSMLSSSMCAVAPMRVICSGMVVAKASTVMMKSPAEEDVEKST